MAGTGMPSPAVCGDGGVGASGARSGKMMGGASAREGGGAFARAGSAGGGSPV
jgi:hypothetical protein